MTYRELVRQHSGPPVNIEAIILGLGLELDKKADLGDEVSGQLERLDQDKFRISVNQHDNYFRQRFTMAHELGHYMLHANLIGNGVDDSKAYRSVPKGNFYNQSITPVEETEANRFAAELLVPRALLETAVQTEKNVGKIATLFQVSKSAMIIRLKGMGLTITDDIIETP